MSGHQRVVVIGAGPNGLVAAAHLAAGGRDVVVLEHSPDGFGGISSADGALPGFRHDVCAGFMPLTVASPAFRSLDLEIDWVTPEHVMAHPFDDGTALALERDFADTARGLGPAGDRYEAFMKPLVDAARPLMTAALEPVPPGLAALEAARRLRMNLLRLAWRALLPAGVLGRRWLQDDRAAAWLAGSTAHSDLDPTSPGGGAFALVLALLAHAYGWPYPRGGADGIARALMARIEADRGVVRHGANVAEIVLNGGRLRGVRLADGELVTADAVIATTSAKPFRDLMPARSLPRGIDWRLRRWRHDMGVFKVDFALDGPVPWLAEECRRASVVHVGPRLWDFVSAFRSGRDGRFPEKPCIVVGQHTLYDQTRAPEGKQTLYTYVRSPLVLDIPAEEALARVEAQIARFAPGFRRTIAGRVVRTPADLQGHDPALVHGDLGGGSYQLDQQLLLRPHPRLWRTRTPITGLYFAGASVHPGGGVHGTQGLTAARMVMRDQH